jgi:hypothetical protein
MKKYEMFISVIILACSIFVPYHAFCSDNLQLKQGHHFDQTITFEFDKPHPETGPTGNKPRTLRDLGGCNLDMSPGTTLSLEPLVLNYSIRVKVKSKDKKLVVLNPAMIKLTDSSGKKYLPSGVSLTAAGCESPISASHHIVSDVGRISMEDKQGRDNTLTIIKEKEDIKWEISFKGSRTIAGITIYFKIPDDVQPTELRFN